MSIKKQVFNHASALVFHCNCSISHNTENIVPTVVHSQIMLQQVGSLSTHCGSIRMRNMVNVIMSGVSRRVNTID